MQNKSWWAPEGTPDPLPLSKRHARMETRQCNSCYKTNPRVYDKAWACLNQECPKFWKAEGGNSNLPNELAFDKRFIDSRSRKNTSCKSQYSLVPNLLSTFSNLDADVTACRFFWRGIVCPSCSSCISRRHWDGWVCETDNCNFAFKPPMYPVSLRSVIPDVVELGPVGHQAPYIPGTGENTPKVEYLKNYRKDTFHIEGGTITHFVANNTVNSRPGGPNDMFQQIQKENLGLMRHKLSQSIGKIWSPCIQRFNS